MEEELYKQKYEIMLILLPDLGEESSKKELDEIKSTITSDHGDILNEDIWGVRDLAYGIRKENQGFYAVLNFAIDPTKLKEVEDALNLNQKVLRHLILKISDSYELKTFEEYEEERAKMQEEKNRKKKEQEEKERKPRPMPAKKQEQNKSALPAHDVKEEAPSKKEPKKEPVKEEKIEMEEKEEVKEEPKKESTLDEVDEKLKSIINDPDISL